jgi:hypothetical protein
MPDVRLTVIPGEAALVAVLEYCTKVRETMSEENRKRADELGLRFLEFILGGLK